MEIIDAPRTLQKALQIPGGSIGFVPTMGALHAGHRELIARARGENDVVVVSIFVNPAQFLEGEDLDAYPRQLHDDADVCRAAGVDYLFTPEAGAMYGSDEPCICAPDVRGYILEGATRPGHFSGVLTVVMKLLHLARPTRAYFGKKDAQQLMLIQTMVRDFFMDVKIVPVDTVRDADGLALSSRNVYLSAAERAEAVKIPRALETAHSMITAGTLQSSHLRASMLAELAPLEVCYLEIVDRRFARVEMVQPGETIILVEAIVGGTRLLDNLWV